MGDGPIAGRRAMIAAMAPRLDALRWHFCTTSDAGLAGRAAPRALGSFAEREGMSFILEEAAARELGFDTALPMAWITLDVHSALDGVGLTAAVAGALADEGIACNIVAARHHDHLFVPVADGPRAMDLLQALAEAQAKAGGEARARGGTGTGTGTGAGTGTGTGEGGR